MPAVTLMTLEPDVALVTLNRSDWLDAALMVVRHEHDSPDFGRR